MNTGNREGQGSNFNQFVAGAYTANKAGKVKGVVYGIPKRSNTNYSGATIETEGAKKPGTKNV